jgi:hypothetical protein
MLYKHLLHRGIGVGQLGIAVREEDYSEGYAENQQAQGLKRVQKFHEVLDNGRDDFPENAEQIPADQNFGMAVPVS